jgi:hypothetical protein
VARLPAINRIAFVLAWGSTLTGVAVEKFEVGVRLGEVEGLRVVLAADPVGLKNLSPVLVAPSIRLSS